VNRYSSADEDCMLAMLLRRASDAVLRARQAELANLGVSTIEAATLLAIDNLGRRALPMRISEWILRRPNSTSALLQRMEKGGLVQRAYDLERKNLVRMALTDYGREVLEKAAVRTSVHQVFGALSDDERACLRAALVRVMTEALGLVGQKAPPMPELL
jgi:DNA-binding MarR family transcriptional regulator